MIDCKGHRFDTDIILLCVRWYLVYPLSYRGLEDRILGKRQPQELQTAFLDRILHQLVTVYLINSIRLVGKVRRHNPFTLPLQDADGIDSLTFKHTISNLIPGTTVVTRERRTAFGRRPEWTGG